MAQTTVGSANQAAPIPRRLFAFQNATILKSEKAAIQLALLDQLNACAPENSGHR
jgi:hypothetical protein